MQRLSLIHILAHCCKPVPGDDIIGFITRGRGVSVHRRDCLNILNLPELDRERLIDVDWAVAEKQGYSADIRIITVNKMGIFAELSRILSNMGVSILGVNAKTGKKDVYKRQGQGCAVGLGDRWGVDFDLHLHPI